jgi:hypothetical protein
MKRIIASLQSTGEAAAPTGEPPRVQPKGRSEAVTVLHADSGAEEAERILMTGISYENDVTFTSETTFVESGTITVGDGAGTLKIDTVGEGHLSPTPDPTVLAGAVTWRIVEADGSLQGATGLITSTFLLSTDRPEYREYLTAAVFFP